MYRTGAILVICSTFRKEDNSDLLLWVLSLESVYYLRPNSNSFNGANPRKQVFLSVCVCVCSVVPTRLELFFSFFRCGLLGLTQPNKTQFDLDCNIIQCTRLQNNLKYISMGRKYNK